MKKQSIGIGLLKSAGIPYWEQLDLIKKTGFDSFFILWEEKTDMQALCKKAQSLGLSFTSLHAPWDYAAHMWHGEDVLAQRGIRQLCRCIDACSRWQIPVMVVHAYMGFESKPLEQRGIDRFEKVVAYAKGKGVQIAFENTEGEEFLFALMDRFADVPEVGFCWDSGHELCYNRSQDLLCRLGDRLIYTHLNDNLGICDPEGQITWLDDLHLLPFDGVADWEGIARRLRNCNFRGALTFEMSLMSKPGRRENDAYGRMPYEAYLKILYDRASKVRSMINTQQSTEK